MIPVTYYEPHFCATTPNNAAFGFIVFNLQNDPTRHQTPKLSIEEFTAACLALGLKNPAHDPVNGIFVSHS